MILMAVIILWWYIMLHIHVGQRSGCSGGQTVSCSVAACASVGWRQFRGGSCGGVSFLPVDHFRLANCAHCPIPSVSWRAELHALLLKLCYRSYSSLWASFVFKTIVSVIKQSKLQLSSNIICRISSFHEYFILPLACTEKRCKAAGK